MYKSRHFNVPACNECEKRKDSFFCSLSCEEATQLSDHKTGDMYKKGQVIFHEGNHPHGMYCIYAGKVKIHKTGDEGKDQIVRLAGPGDILGYRALLSGELYSATASALEDTIVCQISRQRFLEALENNHQLSLKTIQMLTGDLKKSEQKIIDIAQKPVRERIAEALLILKDSFGLEADGKTLAVTLTRREIGDIAGATPETTIRTLSDFNKEGLISLEKKNITITNMPKLVRLANIQD